jgi:hypothetical protein
MLKLKLPRDMFSVQCEDYIRVILVHVRSQGHSNWMLPERLACVRMYLNITADIKMPFLVDKWLKEMHNQRFSSYVLFGRIMDMLCMHFLLCMFFSHVRILGTLDTFMFFKWNVMWEYGAYMLAVKCNLLVAPRLFALLLTLWNQRSSK